MGHGHGHSHSPRHVPLLIQNLIPSSSKTAFADDSTSWAASVNCFPASSSVAGPNSFQNCAARCWSQSIKCDSRICAKNCGICFGMRRRTLSSNTFTSSILFTHNSLNVKIVSTFSNRQKCFKNYFQMYSYSPFSKCLIMATLNTPGDMKHMPHHT